MTNSITRTAPSVKSVYVPGVDFATACSGTKYKNRDDILMIVLDQMTGADGNVETVKQPQT